MLRPHEREIITAYYRELDRSFAHWGAVSPYEMHYGHSTAPSEAPLDEPAHVASLRRMNAIVAERAKLRPGDVVLDAGCGVGATSLWMAKGCGVHVHGITLSSVQVEKARQSSVALGLEGRAHFSVQDYTATSFPDASFDVVWAVESLCHAPRKPEFLAEAHRLLRPGGRLVIADYFRPHEALAAPDRELLQRWADGWVMALPPWICDFKREVDGVGFVGVQAHDLTDAIRSSSAEMERRGRDGLEQDLQHGSARRIAHVQACVAQKQALDRTLWRYLVVVGER